MNDLSNKMWQAGAIVLNEVYVSAFVNNKRDFFWGNVILCSCAKVFLWWNETKRFFIVAQILKKNKESSRFTLKLKVRYTQKSA